MNHRCQLLFAVALGIGCGAGPRASAGTITGTVYSQGPEVPQSEESEGAYQSRRLRFAEKVDYDRLQDFVVYIDQPIPGLPAGDPPAVRTITQKDVNFEPHVLAVVVGTRVRWPNADELFHNVFSLSEAHSFDLGMYTKDKVPEEVFDQVGLVDVFCAIHTRMHCIIKVLPNRFFAKVNANKRYTIGGVPAGTYRLRVWQERVPYKPQQVTVAETGETTADFRPSFPGIAPR